MNNDEMPKSKIELGRFWPTRTVRAESRKVYSTPARLQNCVGLTFAYSSGGRLKLWRIISCGMTGFLICYWQDFFFLGKLTSSYSRPLTCIASFPFRMFLSVRAGREQKGPRNRVLAGKRGNAIPFLRTFCSRSQKHSKQATPPLPGDHWRAM